MKKMQKGGKILAVVLAGLLVGSTMAGCGGANGELDAFKNRPNEVVVYYGANGYGSQWITRVAEKYMTDHNQDTYINLKKTVTQLEDLAKVESGVAVGDLYLLDAHMEEKTFAFENISDVYNSYPIGETEKKIVDKLDPAYKNYIWQAGTQDYIMPYLGISGGYNFAYNKTLLDSILPEGYTLPRTTNEFLELGETIKEDAYLLNASFKDASDWILFMNGTWFAQLLGEEGYRQYLNGRYYDESQEKYLFDETKPTVYEKNATAVEDYFEIMKSMYSKENGYVHEDWVAMDAMDVEAAFAGFGFGQNSKLGAFLIHGTFLEKEMDWLLAEQEAMGNKTEIRMMRTPMASAIIKRTPSIQSEDELRTVIDYVDKVMAGESATKPEGVEDKDIAIIQEARGMSGMYMAGGMIIPKVAKNKAGAKDFMRYLASDEAAIIAAQNVNGINMLPFGKQVTDEELGFARSDFMNDCMKISRTTSMVVSSDSQEYDFSYIAKFSIGSPMREHLLKFLNGTNTLTGKTYYQQSYESYESRWEMMVSEFKNQGGNTAN